MIARLEVAAGQDDTKKDYCDKEPSATNTKKSEKTAEIELLTSRIDQPLSKSAKMKVDVSTLRNELAETAASQVNMDQ